MKPLDMGTTNGSEANNSHMIHFYGLCRNLKLWVIVADGIWTCHNQCHEFPIFSSACLCHQRHTPSARWGMTTKANRSVYSLPQMFSQTFLPIMVWRHFSNPLQTSWGTSDWSPLNHFCHYHCDLQQTLVAFDFGRSLAQNCRIIWDVDPTIRTNLSIFYSTS